MIGTEIHEIERTARPLDLSKPDIFTYSLHLFVGILARLANDSYLTMPTDPYRVVYGKALSRGEHLCCVTSVGTI